MEILCNILLKMLVNCMYAAEFLLRLFANSSETQLASHLSHFRGAASKTRLDDKVSRSQPKFLQVKVSFQLLIGVAPGPSVNDS